MLPVAPPIPWAGHATVERDGEGHRAGGRGGKERMKGLIHVAWG